MSVLASAANHLFAGVLSPELLQLAGAALFLLLLASLIVVGTVGQILVQVLVELHLHDLSDVVCSKSRIKGT